MFMAKRDNELNELLAKRLLADVAATDALHKHYESTSGVEAGAYHGAGGQVGAAGFMRPQAR
jgi:hypothetical protein